MSARIITRTKRRRVALNCRFCEAGQLIDYKDVALLEGFLTSRRKIVARSRTGLCAKHQRQLARAIKRARVAALV